MANPDDLRTAIDSLETAAGTLDEPADSRLADFADQLETFLAEDRTPDHGRLARILHVLDDIETDAAEATAAIADARAALLTYREGVEGV